MAHEMSSDSEESYGDDVENGETTVRNNAQAKKKKKGTGGGGVRFGSVRVRTHELTLGDNPGGKTGGVPLALEWDPKDSTRYENIDEFAVKYHGARDSLVDHEKAHRLKPGERNLIAARHHTPGSIRKIQMEVHEIRKERKESSVEDIVAAEKNDHKRQAAKKKGGGLLGRLFKK